MVAYWAKKKMQCLSLTVYYTIMTFNNIEKEIFLKCCWRWIQTLCMLPANISKIMNTWTSFNFLTFGGKSSLYHTIQTFNDPEQESFGKKLWEMEKRLVSSIFSFTHNVFFSSQGKLNLYKKKTLHSSILTLSQSNPGFTCLQYKSFKNFYTVGKGEIAHYKQFLLFPQRLPPIWRTFFYFHQIWNYLLITSNFSLSHSVFKRIVLQTRKNQGLFGKGLAFCKS